MCRIPVLSALTLAGFLSCPLPSQAQWAYYCPPGCCSPCPPFVCCQPCYYPSYSSYAPCVSCYSPATYSVPAPVKVVTTTGPTTRVSVLAPDGMTVFVEGKRVPLQEGKFTFPVPAVKEGERYVYHFRTETPDDNGVKIERRDVTFRTGDNVKVDFTRPAPVATTKR